MLNSYKDLRRWFPAVEPRDAAAPSGRTDPDLEQAMSQGGAGGYPHYIRETEPEPFDIPFWGESGVRRSEFVGGWSDWVSGDHAPGPRDDYPARDAELVQFPWDEDAASAPRRRAAEGRSAARRAEAEPGDDDPEPVSNRSSGRPRGGRLAVPREDEAESSAESHDRAVGRDAGRARDGRTKARSADTASDDESHRAADDIASEPREIAGSTSAERSARESDDPEERTGPAGRFLGRAKRSARDTAGRPARTEWLAENDDRPGMDDDWLADDREWTSAPRPAKDRRGRLGLSRLRGLLGDSSGRPADGPGAAMSPQLRREAARASRESRRGSESGLTLRDQTGPSSLLVTLVLIVAILVLAAAGAFALYLLHHRDEAGRDALATHPEAVRLTGATTGTTLVCPTERSGAALRGAEPGGTSSGPEAVMWFEHAYYVERSADRALEVAAPGAALPPAAEIQRGIDSVPPGTAYCVVVAPSGDGRYSVEITEQRPGGAPATYDKQTVTTTVDGGRTLITGIAAG
ncbi:hypothetical protein KO481_26615 [Nocardia sp. NEAU-G5]|uniref:DUF8176 domain-containing protein n=1 Tax=Nocardia albiluteola TaxID=2842303 RepID=A0ABS6B468_9NOCA|nr:hypothetical protein [Nocardia albiluteola]MBU3065091.1 hypothetical protein [Nocardia albiluteola]